MSSFIQEAPHLGNQFLEDTALQDILKTYMPPDVYDKVSQDLTRFGHRVVTDIYELKKEATANPPQLIQYDPWGKRIDEIKTSHAWKKLHDISAMEGIVAIGYERKVKEYSRMYQMSKVYMFDASSAVYTCPLAMTDGAAKVLEVIGSPELKKTALARLTSRDPDAFWTSGQWMTEKMGGSDVGNGTETIAKKLEDGSYALTGLKWFTSATDSDMTLTLARIVDKDGKVPQGSRGLSLFFLKVRDENGNLNGITVRRLKDKLGTRAVPTAELELKDAKAYLVGEVGRGVANISHMLNITRIYNGLGALSGMRRLIAISRDYATRRTVFGKKLCDVPLHTRVLAKMEAEFRGCLHLLFNTIYLLGLSECNKATKSDLEILRLITPLEKLYTAKQAVKVISEGLEAIGGQGYMEDTNIAGYIRDAQVLPIWEGTTNVLSMDTLRVFQKHPKAFTYLAKKISGILSTAQQFVQTQEQSIAKKLNKSISEISTSVEKLTKYVKKMPTMDQETVAAGARELAFSISQTYIAALLLEHVYRNRSKTIEKDSNILYIYILDHTPLAHPVVVCEESRRIDKQIGMDIGGYVSAIRSRM